MDRVVQVIERNGPDGELAAATAQAAPSPVVTGRRHKTVGAGGRDSAATRHCCCCEEAGGRRRTPASGRCWPRPHPDRRHQAEQPRRTEARRDRRRGGLDRGRRVPPRTSRLIRDPHIHPGGHRPHQQTTPAAPPPRAGRAAQPAAHRRRRHPDHSTGPSMPQPTGAPPTQPKFAPPHTLCAEHHHRQQNVRRPTSAAPSPPRTKRILQPIDPPSAGMTPIRPAPRHRNAGTRSPRPPAGRREQDRPLRHHRCLQHCSPARRRPAMTPAGCRAPVSSCHTDGAHDTIKPAVTPTSPLATAMDTSAMVVIQ